MVNRYFSTSKAHAAPEAQLQAVASAAGINGSNVIIARGGIGCKAPSRRRGAAASGAEPDSTPADVSTVIQVPSTNRDARRAVRGCLQWGPNSSIDAD